MFNECVQDSHKYLSHINIFRSGMGDARCWAARQWHESGRTHRPQILSWPLSPLAFSVTVRPPHSLSPLHSRNLHQPPNHVQTLLLAVYSDKKIAQMGSTDRQYRIGIKQFCMLDQYDSAQALACTQDTRLRAMLHEDCLIQKWGQQGH